MNFDSVFVTQVMWVFIMFMSILSLSGDDRTWVNKLASHIVSAHKNRIALKILASTGFVLFMISMASSVILAFRTDLFGGVPENSVMVLCITISMVYLSGFGIRLWDISIQKHEEGWIGDFSQADIYMPEKFPIQGIAVNVARGFMAFGLLVAILGIAPGFLLSKRAESWSENFASRLKHNTIVLLIAGMTSVFVSLFVGVLGFVGLMLLMTTSKNKMEYVYGWLMWATVSFVTMLTVTVAKRCFSVWRSRVSDYFGELFGW